MKKEKLIIICVAIIGISLIIVQSMKQNSIEKQQQAELQVRQAALDYQKEQDRQAVADKARAKLMINACIEDAEENYWRYMELNGTGKRYDERGVSAAQYKWDIAEDRKEKDIDNCYRKYNQ